MLGGDLTPCVWWQALHMVIIRCSREQFKTSGNIEAMSFLGNFRFPKSMAQTSIHVRTIDGASAAVGWSGPRTVTIDRSESAGGLGIGFNGGELLFLAIGACYTNDLYREAAKKDLTLTSVRVDVNGDWGGVPARAQNVTFSVEVKGKATKKELRELVEQTDRVAEIHNSLRMSTNVRLGNIEVVSV